MHFTVFVITENKYDIEEALEPFDENMEVEPYVDIPEQEVRDSFAEWYI